MAPCGLGNSHQKQFEVKKEFLDLRRPFAQIKRSARTKNTMYRPSLRLPFIIREGSQNKSIAKRKQKVNPRMSDQSDQPNALTSDEVNYLGLILEIAESRNWQALVFAMTSHTRLFESFARSLARTDELNGMTM